MRVSSYCQSVCVGQDGFWKHDLCEQRAMERLDSSTRGMAQSTDWRRLEHLVRHVPLVNIR